MFSSFYALNDALEFKEIGEQRLSVFRCNVQGGRVTSLDMRLSGPMFDTSEPLEDQLTELTARAIRYWRGQITEHPCIETLITGGVVTPIELIRE